MLRLSWNLALFLSTSMSACPVNFSPIRALFYACTWATWEQRNPRWRPKWSTGKYAPFELKLGTLNADVHVRISGRFCPSWWYFPECKISFFIKASGPCQHPKLPGVLYLFIDHFALSLGLSWLIEKNYSFLKRNYLILRNFLDWRWVVWIDRIFRWAQSKVKGLTLNSSALECRII